MMDAKKDSAARARLARSRALAGAAVVAAALAALPGASAAGTWRAIASLPFGRRYVGS
jgi:hypothetical protein